MCAGSLIERVPGVLQPACACLAVLGASIDRDTAKRMLLLALRGAVSKDVWQVRRDSLQALEALAAAAAAATAPGSSTKAGSEDAATEAPLVRLLAARKQHILQVRSWSVGANYRLQCAAQPWHIASH
jgi:hypothetical protein